MKLAKTTYLLVNYFAKKWIQTSVERCRNGCAKNLGVGVGKT